MNARRVMRAMAAAAVLGAAGCEMHSAADGIDISPASVALAPGQSQAFTVSGGESYAWSLSPEDGSATLSARRGERVVVTVGPAPVSATITVTCTSTVPGASGLATNGAGESAYSSTGRAYVYIK